MHALPTKECVNGTEFTVADFLEAGRESLQLTLIAGGAQLWRKIEEPIVNRPGLALTGFYEHFAWKRLQLVGKAETAYLRSLDDRSRIARLSSLIEHKAFCFIFTNGQRPQPDEIELAERNGAIIMASPLKTRPGSNSSKYLRSASVTRLKLIMPAPPSAD